LIQLIFIDLSECIQHLAIKMAFALRMLHSKWISPPRDAKPDLSGRTLLITGAVVSPHHITAHIPADKVV
jgi:NAD(P)-dependent dehydrogenase (short-subunit alcohol dehydrogenase family)